MNYTRLNEGQQAEEHKARKAKEEEDREKQDKERNERRYGGLAKDDHAHFVGNTRHMDKEKLANASDSEREKMWDHFDDKYCADELRADAAAYVANRNRRGDSFNIDFATINKDMRRHPDRWKKEHPFNRINTKRESCGIFESVRFLDE